MKVYIIVSLVFKGMVCDEFLNFCDSFLSIRRLFFSGFFGIFEVKNTCLMPSSSIIGRMIADAP